MLPYKSDHANAKGALGTRLVAPLAPMTARSERQSQGHSDGVDGFLARAMGLQHALAGPSGGGADRAYAYGAKEMVQRFGLARLAEAVAKWSIRFSFCMPRKLGRHCVGCG